ncbi:hypothetical protein EYZ11_010201 [Aspergillus tanneri]|uniref:Uncharacterized protein n=1 Tax=Aspergillus tanneri TaxID=1220188 RepID=A0A4S3J822_9EURO|nr:hypothetical protein EYZ11_010201 [Aspergillus tanneri]
MATNCSFNYFKAAPPADTATFHVFNA